MRLQRLTGLEMDKIKAEYAAVMEQIKYYKEVLENEILRMNIIKEELLEIKTKYGDKRLTKIEYTAEDFRMEDMITEEDVIITITHAGYVKRTPLTEYRRQNRGGVGTKGAGTKEEDFVEHLFVASTHNYLLLFTEKGRCFWLRAYEIPEGGKTTKGRAIQNLIQIPSDDKVKAYINIPTLTDAEFLNSHYIIMCTRKGTIKKTSLEAYSRPRQIGIHAINILEGDELINASLTNGDCQIVLAAHSGRAIRFHESTVRDMGRTATGVKGIYMYEEHANDEVIGMVVVDDPTVQMLVLSENGYGKRSDLEEYRVTNRGGKGIKTMNITEKTGPLVAMLKVLDTDDLIIITRDGTLIRISVADIRETGRAAQGVIILRLREGDAIASVASVPQTEEDARDLENNPEEDARDLENNPEEETGDVQEDTSPTE